MSCRTGNNEQLPKNTVIDVIKQKSESQILVCAHRSFHKTAPENSMLSIKKAIKSNIDIIEIDVRTTKDSLLVLMHDKTIDRTSNGKGLISDYTYHELLNFYLTSNDSVTFEKIPLLSEVLDLCKNRIIVNLDLKAVNYEQLYNLLKEKNMQYDVISFIGSKDKVQYMLSIDDLYAVLPLSKSTEDILYYSTNTKSALQHFTDESFNKKDIELAKNNGQLIFINSLWDEDVEFNNGNTKPMDSIIALKPNIIQTDHPKLLVEYLSSIGLHN